MSTTTRGVPFPLGSDPNDAQSWLQQLATWVNDAPGVAALTTTAKNALSGAARWDGRVVLDTTLDRLFRWDAGTSTWIQLPDSGDIAGLLATTGTPAALGTASRGVSSSAARADHVHPEVGLWAAYTPAWTALTTNPVLGNGTLTGKFAQIGKTVVFRIDLTIGSTTSFGSGQWRFSLPVTSAAGTGMNVGGFYSDASGGPAVWPVFGGRGITTTTFEPFAPFSQTDTRVGLLTGAAPFTWATSDEVHFVGVYEAA